MLPMRILIATETYVPDVNGVAYFVQRLASLMAHRGHEVPNGSRIVAASTASRSALKSA